MVKQYVVYLAGANELYTVGYDRYKLWRWLRNLELKHTGHSVVLLLGEL